ncbi:PEP/pyruvate-binding domain-containing protein [Kocuria sp. M4R2S49]|uniref:PEP/pyruvate-binding domain-containing protein n=1 Tax=Kocuria rhizosphaericola TaxID=3376284 RepID=UPI00379CE5FF
MDSVPARCPTGPVLDLAQAGAAALDVVGGKAASLGSLLAAGFPVPGGFCLTADVYREAASALDTAAVTDPALAARARAALATARIPEEAAESVRAAYGGLGPSVAVAVRSSATAEDLPGASYAGQQDTVLDVVGADAVLEAVRRCWASLWTDRAVAYRRARDVDPRSVAMAVVVQPMVAAEVSGVLFTANPVTGRRDETVIDAAPGPGAAVVGGTVDPDRFVLDRTTGAVLRDGRGAGPACLSDEQVRGLARLGSRAQEHFGSPQDLEFAVLRDGRTLLLQSRPVTTLYPVPGTAGPGVRAYLCASLVQGLTGPLTPMGLSAFQAIADGWLPQGGGEEAAFLRYVQPGLRLFVDVTPPLRSRAGRQAITRLARAADTRSEAVLRHLMDDPRFAPVRSRRWPPAVGLARTLPQVRALPWVVLALLRPAAALRRAEQAEQELRGILAPAGPVPAGRRLDLVERVLAHDVVPLLMRQLPAPAAGYLWLGLVRWLLRPVARPGELAGVLRGLPHNVTTEMDLTLWGTAVRLREDPGSARALLEEDARDLARRYADGALPPVAQRELREFLARYGHRAVAEIDLGVPRWSEDPAHVLNALANYLRLEDPEQAPDRQFARAASAAEDLAAELARRARARGGLRGRLVTHGLRRVRGTAGLREQPKFGLILAFAGLRHQLRLVGEELARRGRIAVPEDVFFLDLAEARAAVGGADRHGVVDARRRLHEQELRRRHVPRVLLSDGTDVETAMAAVRPAAASGLLLGAAASPGSVTGPARVVVDPGGARLEPGEILVAPSTDPGWTPLFLTAGALVMEMGGPISHGAVVAREYGIPAVVGVPGATERIRTGDVVTVDGAAGTVELHPTARHRG